MHADRRKAGVWFVAGLCVASLGLAGATALAQVEPAPPSAATPAPPQTLTQLSIGNIDTFMVLVPLRSDAVIRDDLTAARTREASADIEAQRSKDVQARAKARIEVKKKEIELVESRIESAKAQKNEADKMTFESQKKVLELEKQLLEKRAQLFEAETAMLEAGREAARASARVYEREMDLAVKRAEIASLGQGALSAAVVSQAVQLNAQIRELEKKTLEAMKEKADKEAQMAQKEKKIAERRLAILEAQKALGEQAR